MPREPLVWTPPFLVRAGIVFASVLATLLVGYLHALTGLDYEFHIFFILPVLTVSWFVGRRTGYALAVLAAAEWFVADFALAGTQVNLLPLVFNTIMRLVIFLYGAWLVAEMRRVLLRESRLAREDALTGLPNRREFRERGQQAFAQAQRQGAPFTAVFIDLDRFKEVNDCHGHAIGDELLTAVARTIRAHVRASDIPGRLGGDEFALLLPNMNAHSASSYVEKLQKQLLSAMNDKGWPVTFSIGVASFQVAPSDFDTLIGQADSLMYEAKRTGRDRILQRQW